MLQISAHTRALAVTNAADTLHVALPPAYVEQFAEAEAFSTAASQTVCRRESLHRAVLDAIQQGRDYLSDPVIRAMALNAQLTDGNILAAARSRTEQLKLAALSDHAGDILDGWADALDEHSAKLAAAANAGVNLNDAAAAVARGGAIMSHLHNAQVAVKAWTAAANGFYALAAVAGVRISADSVTVSRRRVSPTWFPRTRWRETSVPVRLACGFSRAADCRCDSRPSTSSRSAPRR